MEFKDYYQILNVARDATQDEVKTAYRKMARRYHPDVSKENDAEERFKEVGEAYEVLKDPEKRLAYDRLGSEWREGQDFTPPPDWDVNYEFSGDNFTQQDADSFSDFFENLFSHRQHAGRTGPRPNVRIRGDDHFAKVLIELEDAFEGSTRQITLRHPELTADGHITAKERTLKVKIPQGIKPGQQIRLTGQGARGSGGAPAGDLYLEVEFKPHPLYRLDATDIYLELPVTPWEAALSATVKVPTPSGAVDLKIPANSQQGRKLRLRGRGLPSKPSGDMFVVLKIVLPPCDDEKAKAVYQQMARELAFNPRAQWGLS